MKTDDTKSILSPKNVVLVALATALILSVPLVAMQFTEEVDWKLLDFAIMGTLIFGTGTLFLALASKTRSTKNRIIVGAILLLALLLIWAELAVGVFGTPLAGS